MVVVSRLFLFIREKLQGILWLDSIKKHKISPVSNAIVCASEREAHWYGRI